MKHFNILHNRFGKLVLTLGLVFCMYGAPTAQASFSLGGLSSALGDIGGAVGAVANAVSIGTGIVNDLFGILNGGAVSSTSGVQGAGVPNVPNGAILPGPGNSAYGMSYVRDVFLPNLTNWVVSLVLAGSVVVVVAAGIMYATANGNQETSDKARETVVWGVIGVVITALSYAIVRIVITINYLG